MFNIWENEIYYIAKYDDKEYIYFDKRNDTFLYLPYLFDDAKEISLKNKYLINLLADFSIKDPIYFTKSIALIDGKEYVSRKYCNHFNMFKEKNIKVDENKTYITGHSYGEYFIYSYNFSEYELTKSEDFIQYILDNSQQKNLLIISNYKIRYFIDKKEYSFTSLLKNNVEIKSINIKDYNKKLIWSDNIVVSIEEAKGNLWEVIEEEVDFKQIFMSVFSKYFIIMHYPGYQKILNNPEVIECIDKVNNIIKNDLFTFYRKGRKIEV